MFGKDEAVSIYKEQIEFLKTQIEELREEKIELRKQVLALQDALMNIRAPAAYEDLRRDRIPIDEENMESAKANKRFYEEILPGHIKNIEEPMFKDPEDMIRTLSSVMSEQGLKSESLHNNSES